MASLGSIISSTNSSLAIVHDNDLCNAIVQILDEYDVQGHISLKHFLNMLDETKLKIGNFLPLNLFCDIHSAYLLEIIEDSSTKKFPGPIPRKYLVEELTEFCTDKTEPAKDAPQVLAEFLLQLGNANRHHFFESSLGFKGDEAVTFLYNLFEYFNVSEEQQMDLQDFLAVLEQLKIVFTITAVNKLNIKTLHLPNFYEALREQVKKKPDIHVQDLLPACISMPIPNSGVFSDVIFLQTFFEQNEDVADAADTYLSNWRHNKVRNVPGVLERRGTHLTIQQLNHQIKHQNDTIHGLKRVVEHIQSETGLQDLLSRGPSNNNFPRFGSNRSATSSSGGNRAEVPASIGGSNMGSPMPFLSDEVFQNDAPSDLSMWTKKDVAKWLGEVDLERYAETFEQFGVDGKLLKGLTGEEMSELGITMKLHQRKLRIEVEDLIKKMKPFQEVEDLTFPQNNNSAPAYHHPYGIDNNVVYQQQNPEPYEVIEETILYSNVDNRAVDILAPGQFVTIIQADHFEVNNGVLGKRGIVSEPSFGYVLIEFKGKVYLRKATHMEPGSSIAVSDFAPGQSGTRSLRMPKTNAILHERKQSRSKKVLRNYISDSNLESSSASVAPKYEFYDGDSDNLIKQNWASVETHNTHSVGHNNLVAADNSRKRAFAVGEPKSPSAKYEFFNESNNLLVEVSHGINELQQHEDETENLKNIGTEHLLSMPGSVRHLNRDPSRPGRYDWDEEETKELSGMDEEINGEFSQQI